MLRKFYFPGTIILLLVVLCLPLSPGEAAGAWVKIWEIQDMVTQDPYFSGSLPPRDLNGDGTLELASSGYLYSGGTPTIALRIIDLSRGVPEYEESSGPGQGIVGMHAVDLDRDGVPELLVQWTTYLECLKWNGIPATQAPKAAKP